MNKSEPLNPISTRSTGKKNLKTKLNLINLLMSLWCLLCPTADVLRTSAILKSNLILRKLELKFKEFVFYKGNKPLNQLRNVCRVNL